MKNLAAAFLAAVLATNGAWAAAEDDQRADDGGATGYNAPRATTSAAPSRESSNQTARGEQFMNYLMGGSSIAFGAALMKTNCPPCGAHGPCNLALCIAGAGGIAGGLMNIATGKGRSGSIRPTDPNASNFNYKTPDYEGYNGDSEYGGGMADVTKLTKDDLPPAVFEQVQDALATGSQFGLDPTNPSGLEKFKEEMTSKSGGKGLGDSGGTPGSLSALNPESVAAANAAKEKFASKFNVSGVGVEGGGGGGRQIASVSGDDGLDLAGLLNGMKDKRGPASVEGLQKTIGGDPIGVAADNIFNQMTRRYQNKIQTKMFLPPPPPSRFPARK